MRQILQDTHETGTTMASQPLQLWLMFVGCGVLLGMVGCKDLTGSQTLPAGTPDPSFYNTAAGAVAMRNAAVGAFEAVLPQYVVDAGLLTDELEDPRTGLGGVVNISAGILGDPLDERILIEGQAAPSDQDYASLQGARALLAQGIGQLATYDTAAADTAGAKVLRGELYAFAGYTDVLLADLFCSGVPLSTLDFQKDFTYQPSSTTSQIYQAAIAKFDTALALAADSAQVLNMALIGKGRAWLALGQYDSAAATVTTVPTGFVYALVKTWSISEFTVSDREGLNGLPWLSSGDPRTATVTVSTGGGASFDGVVTVNFPAKYSAALGGNSMIPNMFASVPFTLASGVEARLIEAEAALHANSADATWLNKLNQLRATAPIPGTTEPAPQQLLSLTDPGTDSARVALLFAERAAWLFVTGERQGDLRRLVRQYRWPQQQVYPTGVYNAPGTGVYGTSVNAPIPSAELVNPLFHGCLDRDA